MFKRLSRSIITNTREHARRTSNKRASNHRDYLAPSPFRKQGFENFKQMKSFFFLEKNHSFFVIVSNFSNVQSLLFSCQKKLRIRAETTFLRIDTIRYAFYSRFTAFGDLAKNSGSFPEKAIRIVKKDPNFERFEKL